MMCGLGWNIHHCRFPGAQFRCKTGHIIPTTCLQGAVVSLVTAETESKVSNYMILRHSTNHTLEYNYTVCLSRPLYGATTISWFIEWMEANALFGADKIIIYEYIVPQELDPYFEYYKSTGLLDVFPWHFPDGLTGDKTVTHLQWITMQDCKYRMQLRSRYIVMIDMDELIIPRHPDDMTWTDMIKRAGCSGDVCSYSARHLFYCLQCRGNNNKDAGLFMAANRMRSNIITQHRVRSKYIANNMQSLYNGVDFLVHSVPCSPKNTCVMSPDVGGNHHYRLPMIRTFSPKSGVLLDNSTDKYHKILLKSTHKITDRIFNASTYGRN